MSVMEDMNICEKLNVTEALLQRIRLCEQHILNLYKVIEELKTMPHEDELQIDEDPLFSDFILFPEDCETKTETIETTELHTKANRKLLIEHVSEEETQLQHTGGVLLYDLLRQLYDIPATVNLRDLKIESEFGTGRIGLLNKLRMRRYYMVSKMYYRLGNYIYVRKSHIATLLVLLKKNVPKIFGENITYLPAELVVFGELL